MGGKSDYGLTREVVIPDVQDPCFLHSVVEDGDGNFYCTDEINHIVFSFDTAGKLRWKHDARGRGAGEFWYPKGLDLGWLDRGGQIVSCLGICDSWNHRIQFFSLDGAYLEHWNGTGGVLFDEVVDARFFGGDSARVNGGSAWLILDRGHHRLLGLDLTGKPLFQAGRPMFGSLEGRWPIPGLDKNGIVLPPPAAALHDPLYMPLRIFGARQEAIYLWESLSGRLKAVSRGHFFSVPIDLPVGAEWIAADADGLLAHDSSRQVLWNFTFARESWRSVSLDGIPVPGGRSSHEVWVRQGSTMRRLVMRRAGSRNGRNGGQGVSGAWDREVADPGLDLPSEPPAQEAADFRRHAEQVLALGRMAMDSTERDTASEHNLKTLRDEIAQLRDRYFQMLSQGFGVTKDQYSALMNQRLRSSASFTVPLIRCEREALTRLGENMGLALSLFAQAVPLRDDCTVACVSPGREGEESHECLKMRNCLLAEALHQLLILMTALASWSWYARAMHVSEAPSRAANGKRSQTTRSETTSWNFISPHPFMTDGLPHRLREIDTIFVGSDFRTLPVRLGSLARLQDGHLLVTLHDAHQVLKLGARGAIVGPLRDESDKPFEFHHPLGIAVDSAGRIWVSEPETHSVRIFDAERNTALTLDEFVGAPVGLNRPAGLYHACGDRMLVADTGNDRVISIAASGSVEGIFGRTGSAPGTFRQPVAFCEGKELGTCWIVDRLNHRLQLVSRDGTPIRSVGRAGLGPNDLDMPEQAALLEDGSLVVAQSACLKALTVFSPDGEEVDTVFLDYSPKGLLFHGGLLLVCDWFGSHIHVYETM